MPFTAISISYVVGSHTGGLNCEHRRYVMPTVAIADPAADGANATWNALEELPANIVFDAGPPDTTNAPPMPPLLAMFCRRIGLVDTTRNATPVAAPVWPTSVSGKLMPPGQTWTYPSDICPGGVGTCVAVGRFVHVRVGVAVGVALGCWVPVDVRVGVSVGVRVGIADGEL